MDSDFPIRRRELLASGGVAAAVLAAGCSGGGEETNDDEPTDESDDTEQKGTPTESTEEEEEDEEQSEETGPTGTALTGEWATAIPDDVFDNTRDYSEVVLGDQRAYIGFGSGAGVLAFDLTNGELLWRWDEYEGPPAPLLTYHETVGPIAVMRGGENTGDVYALDAASGTVQWEYKDEDVKGSEGAVVDAAGDYAVVGSDVVAVLDAADGSEVTIFGGGFDSDSVDIGTPEALGLGQSELFVVGSFSGTITGYDLETGERRWSVVPDSEVTSDTYGGGIHLLVVDGIVVVVDQNSVFGIDRQAEEITFRIDAKPHTPVGSDTRAFFINQQASDDRSVRAVDVTGSAIDWEQTDVSAGFNNDPALAGDRLLVDTSDTTGGSLTLLDAASGDIVQEGFAPSGGPDSDSEFREVLSMAGDGDTAVVSSGPTIWGLGVGN